MSSHGEPKIRHVIAITYGLVFLTIAVSVGGYYYLASQTENTNSVASDDRSIPIGEVWVTMYPNASLDPPEVTTSGNTTEGLLHFASPDSPDQILAFYQDKLQKNGFRVSATAGNEEGGSMQAMRLGGQTRVLVVVNSEDGGTAGQIRTFAPVDSGTAQ